MLETPGENADSIAYIICAAGLPNTGYTKLRVAPIQGTSFQGYGHHKANRASTARVVPNNNQLERNTLSTIIYSLTAIDVKGVNSVLTSDPV